MGLIPTGWVSSLRSSHTFILAFFLYQTDVSIKDATTKHVLNDTIWNYQKKIRTSPRVDGGNIGYDAVLSSLKVPDGDRVSGWGRVDVASMVSREMLVGSK